MPGRRTTHSDSRLPATLDAAARLFRARGYEGVSMRDIAREVGMASGSLYCHFETKDELLTAVYLKGVEQISAAVRSALGAGSDPWRRLEAACAAHLESILRDDDYAQVVVRVRPGDAASVGSRLVELRNSYEALYSELVDALPVPPRTDRSLLRLMLIGAMNTAPTWYREGGRATPRVIARRFVGLLRNSLDAGA